MRAWLCSGFAVLAFGWAVAQICPNQADYERSARVNDNHWLMFEGGVTPRWLAGGTGFWYETRTRSGKRFRLIRCVDGQRWEAENKEALAQVARASAPTLAEALLTPPQGKKPAPPVSDRTRSPDGQWQVFLRDGNLWLRSLKKENPSEPEQLTYDGNTAFPYEMGSIAWSPDGTRIAANRVRRAKDPTVPLRTSAPEDSLFPAARDVEYARPGDELDLRLPALIDVPNRRAIPLDLSGLSPQYWLSPPTWRPDSKAYTFEFVPRGFSGFVIDEVFADGVRRARVNERADTFVPYTLRKRHDLTDGLSTLWVTERTGWRQLWRFFGDGRAPLPLTQGSFVVRDIVRVDEAAGKVWFTAGCINPAENPSQLHLCVASLDGSGWRDLTPEPFHHEIFLSPDGAYFVDVASRPDCPPVSSLRRTADGSTVAELQRADIADWLKAGWSLPQVFCAKGRDGTTDIWGVLRLPQHFDPAKTYPVLEQIYAGPHDSRVPGAFQAVDYFSDIFTALGFVVVRIDGMGTAWRSKAFHDVCYKNLRDAGFPDRIAWMKAAAQTRPWLDLSRVGVYGWSAGGQNAMGALLWHNDFYKAAIALCGCHDNRLNRLWWNEQWMGWPLGPWYAENSNVVNAHLLKGKLFLVAGENDDNVDPAATLMVSRALIKAGKDFEQLYLPNTKHAISGAFVERKMKDFFVRALLGQTPPPWKEREVPKAEASRNKPGISRERTP